MKYLFILACLCVSVFGQTLSLPPDPYFGVVSTAKLDSVTGWYRYEYTFDRSQFPKPNALSNFYFTVCADTLIEDVQARNVKFYEIEFGRRVKFDDIELFDDEKLVYFSFLSNAAPRVGNLMYKFGNEYTSEKEYVPSCNIIPEPGAALLGAFGLFLLFRKRR
jgi:hypothetical protein